MTNRKLSQLSKLSLLLSLAFAASARAESLASASPSPSINRLDQLLVTATRTEQPLENTLALATVINRDEIEASGPATLTELLQRKAGVEIRATGTTGQPSGVFMRGANGSHTLVLVDGMRIGSSTTGATAFEHIPLDLIERIEVVKGPLSGLYGSDAIGGVVQIFTRAANRPRLTASVGAGSESATSANMGFSATEGKTSLTFDAGYRDVKARSATTPAAGSFTYNGDRDPYRNTHALLKLQHTLWQGETISLNAWQSKGRADFDAGDSPVARNTQTLSGAQLISENKFAADWKSRLILGQTRDESVVASSYPGNFKTRQGQASWFNEFKTWAGSMNAGIEWRSEKLDSSTGYTAQTRETTSIFAGYLERIDRGQFEFNVRRDEEAQFGRRNTGSVAYGYTLGGGASAYLRGGRAFRAPSFNDLYYPGFSNPLLKPETSDQAEAGLRWRGETQRIQLAYFENRIDNLIQFDLATFLPQNVARARIRGWEMQTDLSVLGTSVRGALTVQRPEDRDTGRQLRSRARRFGSLGASRNFGAWDVSGDIVMNGNRFDSANESAATRMGGYTLLNTTVGYRIDKTWRIDVSGQNLTDKRYELAQGYNTPRRGIFVTLRAIAF
jgi:vitamin B12 transporter